MLNTKRSAHEEHRKKDLRQPAKLRAYLGQAPNRSPRHAAQADQPIQSANRTHPERLLLRRPPGPAEGQERHPSFYAEVMPLPPHEEDQRALVPWCTFLKLGGISNHTTRTEYRLLLQHFGSEKGLNAKLPLFLLRDVQKSAASSRRLEPAFRQTRF